MIYLDYSANTPADPAVLDAFYQTERRYIGNPNSTHPAGQAAHAEMVRVTDSIAELLGVLPEEIIYTSGAGCTPRGKAHYLLSTVTLLRGRCAVRAPAAGL